MVEGFTKFVFVMFERNRRFVVAEPLRTIGTLLPFLKVLLRLGGFSF